jgi:hypothetical protein
MTLAPPNATTLRNDDVAVGLAAYRNLTPTTVAKGF